MNHEDISEKYKKWVIKFYSDNFSKRVFFIWLTDLSDVNEKDQLLLTKSEKIIVAKSRKKLISEILKSKTNLPDSKTTKKWLKQSLKCKEVSSIKFDLRKIKSKILSDKLNSKNIETIVNFINLFEDYKIQLQKTQIRKKPRTKELDKIWNYYYDEIFWPSLNKNNQKKLRRRKLKFDNVKLSKEFSKIVGEFEDSFEFIKKA